MMNVNFKNPARYDRHFEELDLVHKNLSFLKAQPDFQ